MTISSKCITNNSSSNIRVEEKGKKALIRNPSQIVHQVIRVDGCAVTAGIASDYVITRANVGDAIIELKGTNVDHAVEQIKATAAHWRANGYCAGKMGGLIVSAQYPRIDTKIQRAKAWLSKHYSMPLRVINRQAIIDDFLDLLQHER